MLGNGFFGGFTSRIQLQTFTSTSTCDSIVPGWPQFKIFDRPRLFNQKQLKITEHIFAPIDRNTLEFSKSLPSYRF